jgi:hypothetical protein
VPIAGFFSVPRATGNRAIGSARGLPRNVAPGETCAGGGPRCRPLLAAHPRSAKHPGTGAHRGRPAGVSVSGVRADRRLLEALGVPGSGLVGVVFAVHPMQLESFVAGRDVGLPSLAPMALAPAASDGRAEETEGRRSGGAESPRRAGAHEPRLARGRSRRARGRGERLRGGTGDGAETKPRCRWIRSNTERWIGAAAPLGSRVETDTSMEATGG